MFLRWRGRDRNRGVSVKQREGDWTVYMVETESGKLYAGIAIDPERRLDEHRSGKKGAKFFRTSPPVRIVYRELFATRSEASIREAQIKKMKRADKLKLVQQAADRSR
ncbi:MAG: GIY-YIG nuclease family protein [Candidatus Nitrohelix vancouverensis]|uniref:GIY-YIG nuclease family protein n=1 Tax=Candidatus Nitrohelix vancouverensis TaxID=2705534 RepID=A0A7T0C4Y2_9BACT|nr:MAG: GIY-YIG nuclease family protein [Candidatus Nitrohelix vancouverensis]